MSGPLTGNSTDLTPGILGTNASGGIGVWGVTESGNAVVGNSNTGTGVIGHSNSGKAGEFQGNVAVTGELTALDITVTGNVTATDVLLSGKDCAEEFDMVDSRLLEPGTVVVVNDEGSISESSEPYNKRVVGVISGAGTYRPAVILGYSGSSGGGRARVALMGRVYCKVDASYSPIDVGDMLTTSPTSGCAMKASDPSMAFGTVVGKALASVRNGRDLIPILVILQ